MIRQIVALSFVFMAMAATAQAPAAAITPPTAAVAPTPVGDVCEQLVRKYAAKSKTPVEPYISSHRSYLKLCRQQRGLPEVPNPAAPDPAAYYSLQPGVPVPRAYMLDFIMKKFSDFYHFKTKKLVELAEKQQSGAPLTTTEAKSLEEAQQDAAIIAEITFQGPVCRTYVTVKAPLGPDGKPLRPDKILHLSDMIDCNELSPTELQHTHEVVTSLVTGLVTGEAVKYRYLGSEQEVAARIAKIKAIGDKWKQWESQP